MSDLARDRFINALKILYSIDRYELVEAGVVLYQFEWIKGGFLANPTKAIAKGDVPAVSINY